MEPPMKHKPSAVPINTSEEELELQDRNVELVKRRRTGFSGSIVQPQQEMEVDMENNVSDGLAVEVSTGDDPMDVLTDGALQSSGKANGRSEGRVRSISFTGNEPARLRLPKICAAIGWKEPSFDFKEQGPPHSILFTCKVTVHLEGLVNTVIECFSDPKPKKKAAQDHAAQGALCGALSALDTSSTLRMRMHHPKESVCQPLCCTDQPLFPLQYVHVSFNLGSGGIIVLSLVLSCARSCCRVVAKLQCWPL